MVHVKAPRLANPHLHGPTNICAGFESWTHGVGLKLAIQDSMCFLVGQNCSSNTDNTTDHAYCQKHIYYVLIRPRSCSNKVHYEKGFLAVMAICENHCNGILALAY